MIWKRPCTQIRQKSFHTDPVGETGTTWSSKILTATPHGWNQLNTEQRESWCFGKTHPIQWMKLCEIHPKHQVLYNEVWNALKDAIWESGITHQLIPPDDHWRNSAGKSTQTQKYHFIGILSGTKAIFQMHICCQLISQAEKQLLLL